jgi:tetratricopeptide (TPR) repeat protein
MSVGGTLGCALVAAAVGGADVERYDIEVALRGSDLGVATVLHAHGKPPPKWELDLVPEMKVASAECGGKPVPSSAAKGTLTLELGEVALDAQGNFAVSIRCEGSPSEHFSEARGGFVRSVVGPEQAYIRSQVAWYPRVRDDPALHHLVIDAPAGMQVRSAGDFEAPLHKGERELWTFETRGLVDRAGLAAGRWSLRSSAGFDALVAPGHEPAADGLLALTRKVLEFHAKDLGALSRSRFALVEMPREFGAGSGYSECGYFLLGPQAFDDGADATWVKGFLAHEAAHQWWGQDGLFSDFANEALAQYSMLRYVESTGGAAAGLDVRRAAVQKVAAAVAAGKQIALADIHGWGGSLDPETYSTHAYEKSMMILVMVRQVIGEEAMAKLLQRFLKQARERRVGWSELREALVASGKGARNVVEQWEQAEVPTLRLEHEAKKSGSGWTITGKVAQSGTKKPFQMSVTVAALCAGKRTEVVVKLSDAEEAFTLKTAAEPEQVLLDPDWLLLVARDSPGGADAKALFESAMKTANNPRESDARVLEKAIADLRGALRSGALSGGEEGAAHTGIGRCLFRAGKLDEAAKELEEALKSGAGGPFHRGWAHLRLGCIADLAGKRKEALEHYALVVDSKGSSASTIEKAKLFQERPYKGFQVDG